jgi:hypothetical protein
MVKVSGGSLNTSSEKVVRAVLFFYPFCSACLGSVTENMSWVSENMSWVLLVECYVC